MVKVKANIGTERYRIEIKSATDNLLVADEPIDKGGKDTGFSPKELLVAALSACTTATLKMFMEHKNWPVAEIKVETELTEENEVSTFIRIIHFSEQLTDEQKKILLNVAKRCPVHKILAGEKKFTTTLV